MKQQILDWNYSIFVIFFVIVQLCFFRPKAQVLAGILQLLNPKHCSTDIAASTLAKTLAVTGWKQANKITAVVCDS